MSKFHLGWFLGPGITIRGQNGYVGYQTCIDGNPGSLTVVNQGTISCDVSGGTIYVVGQTFTNQGILAASNGGQLSVQDMAGNVGQVSLIAGSVWAVVQIIGKKF